jgi:GNAT superfamily N-acetyltransferase
VRVTNNLRAGVARRLVSRSNENIEQAAEAFLANAPLHGIDLRNAYATIEGESASPRVREVCLVVLGSGRTASLFLSESAGKSAPRSGKLDASTIERALCTLAATNTIAREFASEVALFQSLPDPAESSHAQALEGAGFASICTLLYMRRAPRVNDRIARPAMPLPEGVEIVPVKDLPPNQANSMLIEAMQQSYVATLDCPELCGLRATADILQSHRATGTFDASLWWLVLHNKQPAGCAFFSLCPAQRMVELVYLGLSQPLRGKGLGKHLLHLGVHTSSCLQQSWPMACAVDVRNVAARTLYERDGFTGFAQRAAYVKPCTACNL